MTLKELLDYNAENYCKGKSWWAYNAFHFSDINNIVEILDSGFLYSRSYSQKNNLMQNENASRQVIDMTSSDILSYVRFYFRPLTPTQYHNEGYKHIKLRYNQDPYASVPVPIFLVFNLQILLQDNNTLFSSRSQAGFYTPELHCGISEFAELDFKSIYAVGPMTNPLEETKTRQAEILYPKKYPIENSLRQIVCRNEIERNTLLKLLRKRSNRLFAKYKDKIIVKREIFEKNGLYVNSINYYNGHLEISFNENYEKIQFCSSQKRRNNVDKLDPVQCEVILRWSKMNGALIDEAIYKGEFDYETIKSISCNLPIHKDAKILEVTLLFDKSLMCSLDLRLSESEVF